VDDADAWSPNQGDHAAVEMDERTSPGPAARGWRGELFTPPEARLDPTPTLALALAPTLTPTPTPTLTPTPTPSLTRHPNQARGGSSSRVCGRMRSNLQAAA